MIAIPFFASGDGYCQFVGSGRGGAGSIRRKGAGWIGCFIEIQVGVAIGVRTRRIQKPAPAIGIVFVGLIRENEVQMRQVAR